MQAEPRRDPGSINWVLTSYIVASAIALPIAGWLADRVGRNGCCFWAVVSYHHASFLALSPRRCRQWVGFRILQALAARSSALAQATLFDITRPAAPPRRWHCSAAAS